MVLRQADCLGRKVHGKGNQGLLPALDLSGADSYVSVIGCCGTPLWLLLVCACAIVSSFLTTTYTHFANTHTHTRTHTHWSWSWKEKEPDILQMLVLPLPNSLTLPNSATQLCQPIVVLWHHQTQPTPTACTWSDQAQPLLAFTVFVAAQCIAAWSIVTCPRLCLHW